jgi:hypothetical protein
VIRSRKRNIFSGCALRGGEPHGKEAVMRRILVVDDDPHVGRAIEGWLRYHGFRVQLADSHVGGLTALDHFGFDLMIVDVNDVRPAWFRVNWAVSFAGAHSAADRNFRFRLSESLGDGGG